MNELVQLVVQKTGLSQDRAQEVVNLVVNHLKGRLPQGLAGNLDSFLGSSGSQQAGTGANPAERAKSAAAGVENPFKKPGQ